MGLGGGGEKFLVGALLGPAVRMAYGAPYNCDLPAQGAIRYLTTGYATCGAVPEPAAWVLLLVGFGGLGSALRIARRKRGVAAATA